MATDLKSILRLEVPVIVQIASRTMKVGEVAKLTPGAIVELPKLADEELDIFISNRLNRQRHGCQSRRELRHPHLLRRQPARAGRGDRRGSDQTKPRDEVNAEEADDEDTEDVARSDATGLMRESREGAGDE
jgi:hypothetical protein